MGKNFKAIVKFNIGKRGIAEELKSIYDEGSFSPDGVMTFSSNSFNSRSTENSAKIYFKNRINSHEGLKGNFEFLSVEQF